MKETLTAQQKNDLFVNSLVVGMFTDMFTEEDLFFDLAYPICLGYYTVRSANKTVSPIFNQLFDFVRVNELGEDYISIANTLLGSKIIRPKFIDKWTRVYNTLIEQQYNPLDNVDITETKSGYNQDTTTYNSNVENNGKTGTKEVVTTNNENSNDVFGFNSSSPVGDTVDTEKATETTYGNAEDNTTHNLQTKTGSDNTKYDFNESTNRKGRNGSGADLIEAELNVRNTQIFFDIVYRDIDSVATISIYN